LCHPLLIARKGSGDGWKADVPDFGMGQRFPSHVVVYAGGTIRGENGGHLREFMAKPVMKMIVSNFPGGMFIEREEFRRRGIVGWQKLRLVFQGRHDPFA